MAQNGYSTVMQLILIIYFTTQAGTIKSQLQYDDPDCNEDYLSQVAVDNSDRCRPGSIVFRRYFDANRSSPHHHSFLSIIVVVTTIVTAIETAIESSITVIIESK